MRNMLNKLKSQVDADTWKLADQLLLSTKFYKQLKLYDPIKLRKLILIAKAFPKNRRNTKVSFDAHSELLGLDNKEQSQWLRKAEQNKWTALELRKEIRKTKALFLNKQQPIQHNNIIRLYKLLLDIDRIVTKTKLSPIQKQYLTEAMNKTLTKLT